MRFDEQKQIYRDCRWCGGKGCLQCKNEADKAYKAAFPDGPQPIATFPATAEGLDAARKVIGIEAIQKAFGPGGGGVDEIRKNFEALDAKDD